MPGDTKEPQSYGSGGDWVTGKTGQEVNRQKSGPAPEHSEFYDERRGSDENHGVQGGQTSPVQLAEGGDRNAGEGSDPADSETRVSARESGAKRDSFFKKRDYE